MYKQNKITNNLPNSNRNKSKTTLLKENLRYVLVSFKKVFGFRIKNLIIFCLKLFKLYKAENNLFLFDINKFPNY